LLRHCLDINYHLRIIIISLAISIFSSSLLFTLLFRFSSLFTIDYYISLRFIFDIFISFTPAISQSHFSSPFSIDLLHFMFIEDYFLHDIITLTLTPYYFFSHIDIADISLHYIFSCVIHLLILRASLMYSDKFYICAYFISHDYWLWSSVSLSHTPHFFFIFFHYHYYFFILHYHLVISSLLSFLSFHYYFHTFFYFFTILSSLENIIFIFIHFCSLSIIIEYYYISYYAINIFSHGLLISH